MMGIKKYPVIHIVLITITGLLLSACSSWRGIANVPLPGGPGSGPGSYTIYAEMPDTLALNGNSRVMLHDVYVGTVKKIELKNWTAVLTLRVAGDVKLPKNTTAKIGQTSLLGSQHVELDTSTASAGEWLKDGDIIPLKNSSAYPTVERTMAAVALLLTGGGIANLESISQELSAVLSGRADQIHDFVTKLDIFTTQLNEQRDDLTRAIDSADHLMTQLAARVDVFDRVLGELPPLIRHFNDKQVLLVDAINSVGHLGDSLGQLQGSAQDLHQDLLSLQCVTRELGKSAPYLPKAFKIMFTQPYTIDGALKAIRGDAINDSLVVDLTYASIDNAILTGTGFSGALRALEQSFGHDPAMMIPDIRYTPNPLSAPGGPYVERADRNC